MTTFSQKLFRAFTASLFRKQFGAVLVAGAEHLGELPSDGGVILVLNHPSWWDPLLAYQMTRLLDNRAHYGAMDAKGVDRYPIFRRLGMLSVDTEDVASVRKLIREVKKLLNEDYAAFWVTAQGEFVDPRKRPIQLREGATILANTMKHGRVVPVAIEYVFGVEKQPDVFVRIGVPIEAGSLRGLEREVRHQRITQALEVTMDELAEQVIQDERHHFVPLLRGRTGLGGFYDRWLRFRARLQGRTLDASHRAILSTKEPKP